MTAWADPCVVRVLLIVSQHYIKTSDDPVLLKWWAQYCESHQQVGQSACSPVRPLRLVVCRRRSFFGLSLVCVDQFDDAIKFYSQAKDTQSLVRILCHLGEDAKAATVCADSGDLASCYKLAQHFEQQDKIKEAIVLFTKAKRFNHGQSLPRPPGG